MSRRTLGRGLQALLGVDERARPEVSVDPTQPLVSDDQPGDLRRVPVNQIDVNPFQPRKDFDSEELASLARSIATHGVIQPIVVRPFKGRYQLVAGERRLRAAKECGLELIPARVLDLDDRQTCELALIENLQRRDLNAIEKARAFDGYLKQFGGTHDQLAAQLGVDRSSVSNMLRLLELPESVQEAVRSARISFGHARALLAVPDPAEQARIYAQVVDESLSVRQLEALIRGERGTPGPAAAPDGSAKPTSAGATRPARSEQDSAPAPALEKSNHVLSLETELRHRFGVKVEINQRGVDRGQIVIAFESHDDFERVLELLRGR